MYGSKIDLLWHQRILETETIGGLGDAGNSTRNKYKL